MILAHGIVEHIFCPGMAVFILAVMLLYGAYKFMRSLD